MMKIKKKERSDRSKMIRTFIAVEIPEDLKQALQRLQGEFGRSRDRVTWVKPAGMHITLKFLGDIEEQRIPELGEKIRESCAGRSCFPVRLSGTGVFPGMKRPRVLWVGIVEGAEELRAIFQNLDPRLSEIGFSEEKRPFRPHITLGRIKEIRDPKGFKTQMEMHREVVIGSMTAHAVHLVESRLRPEGAVYRSRLAVSFE